MKMVRSFGHDESATVGEGAMTKKERCSLEDELSKKGFLFDLHSRLNDLQKRGLIELEGRGEGRVRFHAYLPGRKGPNQGFLQVAEVLEVCYVRWLYQPPKLVEIFKKVWFDCIPKRSRRNPDGANLRPPTTVEDIVRCAKRYAEKAKELA